MHVARFSFRLDWFMSGRGAVTAVVLAGGEASDPLAAAAGVASKALAPLAGRPLAAYVLAALAATPSVQRVLYVGPTEGLPLEPEHHLAPGTSFTASLTRGCEAALAATPEARLLVLTADLPWLRAEGLERFIREAPEADLVYPSISREDAEAQFPGQRRTYARLREGVFTGGNAVLLMPGVVPRVLQLAERAYRARKNPLALAGIIGPGVLFNLLLGRASISELETRVGRLLGGSVRAFISADASLGADVDTLEQLAEASSLLLSLTNA